MRIDTHHHFYSPGWKEAEKGFSGRAGGFVFPGNRDWTPEKSLEDMAKGGVEKAILSLASTSIIASGAKSPNTPG